MAVKNLTSPRAPVPRPADLLTVADSPWRGFFVAENEGVEVQTCNTVGFWLKSVFQSSLSDLWCDAFQHVQSKSGALEALGDSGWGDIWWHAKQKLAVGTWKLRHFLRGLEDVREWWSHGCTAGRPNSQSDLGFSNRVLLKSSKSNWYS